jgi:two-component system response regulator FixJ
MQQVFRPSALGVTGVRIAIVDDDSSVCEVLAALLRVDGFIPQAFGNAASFLEAAALQAPACVILDIHLPDQSGLDVLRQLTRVGFAEPVLVMSGQSDIATAVEAMKIGAFDFLEKPFAAAAMIERVRHAMAARRTSAASDVGEFSCGPEGGLLTRRERDVLAQIANGSSNKEAGRRLGISPRTIEVHRARVMEKLGAKNAVDLMRIVLAHAPGSRPDRAAL